ncbi:MAG: tryptophan synthase subunit alpha [Candidatus Hadarchaeales archaeon]
MELEEKFEELKGKGEGALMPHVYFGDPSPGFSFRLIHTLAESGADLLELGIPFSDPIADGPTFIAACERALAAGVTPRGCLEALRRLRGEGLRLPVLLTTYYNVIFSMGLGEFCAEAGRAGAQGLIVPDLPVEEAGELLEAAGREGLHVIFQVAPTTSERRLERIVGRASGFLYVIGVEGVTGAREEVEPSTVELIRRVRRRTSLPLLAGFGISRPEHVVSLLRGGADGCVVGSAIARIYSERLEEPEQTLPGISRFVRSLKEATRSPP